MLKESTHWLPAALLRFFVGAGAASLLVTLAGATTITTSNYNVWKSSAYLSGSPTEVNFLAINAASYNTSAGIILTPSSTSTPAFQFTGMDNGSYSLSGDVYAKTLSASSDSGAYINVALQAPQNALLLSFANSLGTPYTISLSDGETFSTTSKVLGLSISHPITSLTIATSPGVQAVLNDLWYGASSLPQDPTGPTGNPAATPEPATLLLIAGGFLLLAGARRKFGMPAALPAR